MSEQQEWEKEFDDKFGFLVRIKHIYNGGNNELRTYEADNVKQFISDKIAEAEKRVARNIYLEFITFNTWAYDSVENIAKERFKELGE